jgi:hypothetical protein
MHSESNRFISFHANFINSPYDRVIQFRASVIWQLLCPSGFFHPRGLNPDIVAADWQASSTESAGLLFQKARQHISGSVLSVCYMSLI